MNIFHLREKFEKFGHCQKWFQTFVEPIQSNTIFNAINI